MSKIMSDVLGILRDWNKNKIPIKNKKDELKIIPLKTKRKEIKEDCINILKQSMQMDFDEVIVIGRSKENIRITYSGGKDIAKKIGLIEMAKLEIWHDWV